MNKQLLLGAALSTCLAGEAMAACSDPLVTNQDLADLIAGNTVCAAFGGNRWQEQHRGAGTSGELWDYKQGPGHPVDPTSRVGSWEVRTAGREQIVRYIYGAGAFSYNYQVRGTGIVGQPHSFCGAFDGGVDIDNALILPGEVACP